MHFKISELTANGKLRFMLSAQCLAIIMAACIIAKVLTPAIWADSTNLFHTIIELGCIFMSLSIFTLVWHTHNLNTTDTHLGIIGYGFLSVVMYDALHTYFYIPLNQNVVNYNDLTARFWLLGRLTEGVVILLSLLAGKKLRLGRWISLPIALLCTLSISYLALSFYPITPILYNGSVLSPLKKEIEYFIIVLNLVNLFILYRDINNRDVLVYRFIFMAVLVAFPSELCFTLYNSKNSFHALLGHILKFAYYCFLFKGIFISTVTYPYIKLMEEQQRMVQQEKLALLGQLGASIVHETKNSLATIKGSSQLLSLIAEDDKVKKYAKKIDEATDEVNRIISDFLTLSKPRPLLLNEISINQLIHSMKTTLETSSLLKGVDININFSPEEKKVVCDELQIKQVLLNISKNAVEAMKGIPTPVLAITTGLSPGQEEMYIKISDNGKGIPREEQEKLGTPFFTTKENGTGLGLSACFKIIRDHKGRINIESTLGKGSSFIIYLPCTESLPAADTCLPVP